MAFRRVRRQFEADKFQEAVPVMLRFIAVLALTAVFTVPALAQTPDRRVMQVWPDVDWSTSLVPLDEIISGGVPRDGIPPVYDPRFLPASRTDLPGTEPVIGLEYNGVARAYPLRYMTSHEIVNDVIGGVPLAVTYCPLCNTAMVFDRRVDGRILTMGVSGLLRHSDLIMWDHESESLWQQFEGRAIVGPMAGAELRRIPSRMESYSEFLRRHPNGQVLAPPRANISYGRNPYVGYDELHRRPFLYRGDLPRGIAPMLRVVVVEEKAWSLADIAEAGQIVHGDLRMTVTHEQNSALDASRIAMGRSVAGVVVERRGPDGEWRDEPHEVTFAFVFHAFHPDGEWMF